MRFDCALGLLLPLATSFGCTRPAAPPPKPVSDVRFESVPVDLDSNRLLRPDAERAEQLGAKQFTALSIGVGAPGDQVDGMLHVPAKACAFVFARASKAVEDIDLFVYGDDGSTIASDESQDKTPSLMICPPHPARVYVAARVAQGRGLVAIGALEVDASLAARVGSTLGARNDPETEQQRAGAWPDLEEHLAEHRRSLGARWQDVRRAALPLDARVPTRLTTVVEAGRCLDVLLLPSEEVSSLEVNAFDTDGRIVAHAVATGRDRTMVLCSPAEQTVTLEARPHAGRGLGVLLLSRTDGSSEAELDRDAPVTQLINAEDLETARKKLGEELQKSGYSKPDSVLTGTLTAGAQTSVSFDLKAGCTRLDILTGTPGRGASAWLWSENSDLLAEGSSLSTTTMFACGTAGKARLDLEPLGQSGSYAVELRAEAETPGSLNRYPLAASRLLARMLARGVIRSADPIGAAQPLHLVPEKVAQIPLMIPVGRCIDVNLGLGPGAQGARIRIVEDSTKSPDAPKEPELAELGSAQGNVSASARVCALDRRSTVYANAEFRVSVGATDALAATRLLAPRK